MKTKTHILPVSVNDLRDKYFSGQTLTKEEKLAMMNYDQFRINYLNDSSDEEEFQKRYLELQAKANLTHYSEFLKEPYAVH
jgi:hypothetical protein